MRYKGIKSSLKKYEKSYRLYDPAMYLYKLILDYKGNRFSDEFIELVYTTLKAWNMDSRAAKLSSFGTFKNSILKNKKTIKQLLSYKLGKLNESKVEFVLAEVKSLFRDLVLVAKGKPKLVTYSKTLHFFVPHLFMPIDRSYTLNHFPYKQNLQKNSFLVFEKIFRDFNDFACKYNLEKFIDNNRHRNIPKIIDNMIIGHKLL